jgi:enoyl-CoA hydratase/carnithine racemase
MVPILHGFRLEIDGVVGTLVIDRPEKRNALTNAMWCDIPRVLDIAGSEPAIKVLVVRGAGHYAFSAGADIEEYRAGAGNVDWARRSRETVAAGLEAFRAFEKPTIASIRGHCVGGGVGIALACDFRIAERSARFAIPPAKLGLVYPFSDTRNLVQLVGPARAKMLLFTGKSFTAKQAFDWGFVEEVTSGDKLDVRVRSLADSIGSVSQGSVEGMKRIVSLVLDGAVEEPEDARRLSEAALLGADHKKGVAAFLEGRNPNFR